MREIIMHPWFERFVIVVIVLNAATLGLETYPHIMASWGETLTALDRIFLMFFVFELGARLFVFRRSFWKDGWNIFDAVVVLLTTLPYIGIPGLGNVSAFRALRLLRVLSAVPAFRKVLRSIARALSGSFAVMAVLTIILYVYAVVSVKFFGESSPEYFANLHTAFFTYFQIMTLDAWSDIVRPLMAMHWWAGIFFVSFIMTAVFVLLSIIIGIASNAVNHVEEPERS